MNKSIELIKQTLINKNDYIVVGCSGGGDSMALLDLLSKNGYRVVCAHVNHKIREESDNEFIFVKEYCKKNDILFEGLELKKIENQNESFYRKKRYEFYKKIAEKYKTKYIATAHHGDDLIETILMRISRGSNLKGYLGFSKKYEEDNYVFIKPLIYYTKEEIENYNKINNIPYVHDKTNDDDTYTRNRYRHYILPFLKNENKKIHIKYLEYSEEIENANNYILEVTKENYNKNFNGNVLDLIKFQNLNKYIKQKEIEYILSKIYGNDINKIKSFHVKQILLQLDKEKNFRLNYPENIVIERKYDKLCFEKKSEAYKKYCMKFEKKLYLPTGDVIERISFSDSNSNNLIRLNSEEITLPLYVKNRTIGETIEVKNLNGHQKIKSLFINKKIPIKERESWPIVVDSNNTILWVPGVVKSKFDTEKDKKYDIILKYTRKEEINEK